MRRDPSHKVTPKNSGCCCPPISIQRGRVGIGRSQDQGSVASSLPSRSLTKTLQLRCTATDFRTRNGRRGKSRTSPRVSRQSGRHPLELCERYSNGMRAREIPGGTHVFSNEFRLRFSWIVSFLHPRLGRSRHRSKRVYIRYVLCMPRESSLTSAAEFLCGGRSWSAPSRKSWCISQRTRQISEHSPAHIAHGTKTSGGRIRNKFQNGTVLWGRGSSTQF